MYNKTSIKRNILTIKQNISGSRSGCIRDARKPAMDVTLCYKIHR